ncbi:MAG: hypothetical protein R3F60_16305 [bacterium]
MDPSRGGGAGPGLPGQEPGGPARERGRAARAHRALLLPARRELVSSRPASMPVPLRPSGGWMPGQGTPPPSLEQVRAPALRSSAPPRPVEAVTAPPRR